jgi:nicotinamide phosphoribosyltransferase
MTNLLRKNLILNADSYKLGHSALYPKGTTGMHAYIEARKPNEMIVPFGLQMWIKKNLLNPITQDDINEYVAFGNAHGEPVFPELWEYLLKKYNGFLPVTIHGVPEGTPVKSQTPLVTIECLDEKLFWLPSYLETNLQRGIWYPTTIASNDRKNYLALKTFYDKNADDYGLLPFHLHDFAGRGVSSQETAEIGGAAHLVHFMGSDTIEGVRAANFYYNEAMAAFSVIATEHSIQCSYGPDNQEEYLKNVLDTYAKLGAIVSIVLDGYDVIREAKLLGSKFKEQIIKSGAKIVYRPDSGDFMKLIPELLAIQENDFGFTLNSKGFKIINNVGLIQGDGIDHNSMVAIEQMVSDLGYVPGTVIYGSGGKLLQSVGRDDYGFAQKTSAILIDGIWQDVFKSPATDPGKRSKAGKQTTDNMVKFYENGKLLVDDSLAVIRERAKN